MGGGASNCTTQLTWTVHDMMTCNDKNDKWMIDVGLLSKCY